jgi:SAM-dependent methyltransferase
MSTLTSKLADKHRQAFGLEEDIPLPKTRSLEEYIERHSELDGIPAKIIREAWFTLSHLLLEPGSHLVNMSCQHEGMLAYAMAVLEPQIKVTGVDRDKQLIKAASDKYQRANLSFIAGKITDNTAFEKESVDAIVNSFVLHNIFSNSKYDDRPVTHALDKQFSLLKPGGFMFIRDYAMPPPGEYVLMEMPDTHSKGKELSKLSEADLLIWYSENARPKEDKGCGGFFLEELPPRYPQTRLFRLPYKWAYEFITRKDDRDSWEKELPKEYTFFTQREYRKNLRFLGARVLYTAPHWDQAKIREHYDGSFLLYDDLGTPIGAPPTSFIAVAQKMREKESLRLHERRPSGDKHSSLRISAMRNNIDGRIFDIVTRDIDLTEVIPYRITSAGELNIFVHEALPRGIVNSVPRTGKELDGKRWSGHMTEAISVETHAIEDVEEGGLKETVKFARDYLGLKPYMEASLEKGTNYFPAPDFIDERIGTRYLHVKEHEGEITPKNIAPDIEGFTTTGHIREVSAQSILNAIAVGFVPNARLELQIQELFEKLNIEYEAWVGCPLTLKDEDPVNEGNRQDILARIEKSDNRFRSVRGTTGSIRSVQSIFVDEGRVDGALSGLTSNQKEFVVSDGKTVNVAVVIPLTKGLGSGEVMAGVVTEYLPVPQRHTGNGFTLRAPSYPLPPEITNIEMAKGYIAEKFGVGPEDVVRLGESYFCHSGITQQRIFPFAVAASYAPPMIDSGPVSFIPIWYMRYMGLIFGTYLDWNQDEHLLGCMKKIYQRFGEDSDLKIHKAVGTELFKKKEYNRVMEAEEIKGLEAATPPPANITLPFADKPKDSKTAFSFENKFLKKKPAPSEKEKKEGEDISETEDTDCLSSGDKRRLDPK